MSILHICCNLAGSGVFKEMFEALRDEGVEQIVFVPEKRKENLGRGQPEGVTVHDVLTVRKSDSLFFSRKAKRTVPEILRRVDMRDVRLVHAHTLFTDGSIALRLSQQTGVPYIVTLRYSDIDVIWRLEPHLRPLAREILRGAQRIVFLSEGVRARVLESWQSGAEREEMASRSVVIPNGISPAWMDGEPRLGVREPVRVGFAGRLNRRKRPLDALAAVREASSRGGPAFVLCAAGSGPLEGKLKQAMRPEDRYFGQIEGLDAMKRFYAGCDVLLVPSSAETFGMVYLEAMSQGVPVIYTRGQGFDGQFAEGEVGYSAPCGDTRAQADRLIQILDNYAERSKRCVQRAAGYASPIVAQKLIQLYASVCRHCDGDG